MESKLLPLYDVLEIINEFHRGLSPGEVEKKEAISGLREVIVQKIITSAIVESPSGGRRRGKKGRLAPLAAT